MSVVAEIVILAMVFLFVALRLWSVLGRRTGHEQPLAKPIEAPTGLGARIRQSAEALPPVSPAADAAVEPQAAAGVRSIADADRSFDAYRFLEGAKSAYRMILEAFWRGDEDELARLVDEDVRSAFVAAIADRHAAGHTLENRLIAIENAVIDAASIQNQVATIRVRFDADIAAVTRDAEGTVVAGSLSDAVPTHDVWTFSRSVGAADPNWILVETDEAA
jgi:predicted lipid-binding transport protein (Tim44 family)